KRRHPAGKRRTPRCDTGIIRGIIQRRLTSGRARRVYGKISFWNLELNNTKLFVRPCRDLLHSAARDCAKSVGPFPVLGLARAGVVPANRDLDQMIEARSFLQELDEAVLRGSAESRLRALWH